MRRFHCPVASHLVIRHKLGAARSLALALDAHAD